MFSNALYFHHYRGETTITSLFFNDIVENLKSDIFSQFVFNNIVGLTLIFSPRVFSLPITRIN
jgi:hypothetical protein